MANFGADDPKAGAVKTLYALLEDSRLNHRATVVSGVLAERASGLLSRFFERLRERKKVLVDKQAPDDG